MIIYIALKEESYEQPEILGLFATLPEAKEACAKSETDPYHYDYAVEWMTLGQSPHAGDRVFSYDQCKTWCDGL